MKPDLVCGIHQATATLRKENKKNTTKEKERKKIKYLGAIQPRRKL